MISTRDLSLLPDIDALRRLMQSLAMLDEILSRAWEFPKATTKYAKGAKMEEVAR